MAFLEGLSPERVFFYFEELAALPHGSGNTAAVSDYLENFAKQHSLDCRRDNFGNVVIFAEGTAGYEASSPVILQGHMDMVCVASESVSHDFGKEGLHLGVEGDEIYAEGTSLGGDDGIAVAYMLAILESDSLPHPPLDCVFTNDEEVGMLGADALDCSILRGRTMINLDSDNEGVITCGCAGGAIVNIILPIRRVVVRGIPLVIRLEGLTGGHSGSMIASGRGSANKLMGRFLFGLKDVAAYCLEAVSGGEKDNAIAVSAKAHLVADAEEVPKIEAFAAKFNEDILEEFSGIESSVCLTVAKGEEKNIQVLDLTDQDKAIALLLHAPQGVRKMSGLFPDTVETSSNIGIVRTTQQEFVVGSLVRSAVRTGKTALEDELKSLAELTGARIHITGDYPEWACRKDSPLQKKMGEIYQRIYGKAPTFVVCHGGLECGIFSNRIEGLDVVSIGPDMKDIHTANERLSVSSSARIWEYLLALLKDLK